MKLYGTIWIFVASLFICLGISSVALSAADFIAAPLAIIKLVIGCYWTVGGVALLAAAIRLLVLNAMMNTLDKRKETR